MQDIIGPIARESIKTELNADTFLRKTNKGENEIYVIDSENGPLTLREIGRLRELSFRDGGGGTGKEVDLDEHDFGSHAYKQLLVWDPQAEEIIGGYRYMYGMDSILPDGNINMSTLDLFDVNARFTTEILPKCIELGRSFVQPKYQPQQNRKGLFSLDNLWDGLGALTLELENVEYLFGKVTMYQNYQPAARDILLTFLHHFFGQADPWVHGKAELVRNIQVEQPEFLAQIKGLNYKEAYLILNRKIRDLGENIPPLINSYMNISPTMQVYDTCVNPFFGDVEETAIMITIKDIYPTKKNRHLDSYQALPKSNQYLKAYWRRAETNDT